RRPHERAVALRVHPWVVVVGDEAEGEAGPLRERGLPHQLVRRMVLGGECESQFSHALCVSACRARKQGASQRVVGRLASLERDEYESLDDVVGRSSACSPRARIRMRGSRTRRAARRRAATRTRSSYFAFSFTPDFIIPPVAIFVRSLSAFDSSSSVWSSMSFASSCPSSPASVLAVP